MIKICFLQAEEVIDGIKLLTDDLRMEITGESNADIVIDVYNASEDLTEVKLSGNRGYIKYGGGRARLFRGIGLICEALEHGKTEFYKKEKPNFITNGPMIDVSRNAVLRPGIVKAVMRKIALMGLNMFMLYTEDTYEIENRPYFGHMRGRYTREEIRDMDEYAKKLGIELVPCIQTLSHLATALAWNCMEKYRDTHDTLLVESEKTYELIDDMLKSVASAFSSRRVHIGMDEAKFLGGGRYREDKECPRMEIFVNHLNRVTDIVKKYGLCPMMWSDMFFAATETSYGSETGISDDVLKRIPRDLRQVFWSYDAEDESFYSELIKKHEKLCDDLIFAGGIWTWSGFCPAYRKTIAATLPALSACIKNDVKEVIATIWHNGAECCLITSLLGLLIFAEIDYNGFYDEESVNRRFEFICRASADDILDMEKADLPDGVSKNGNATRYLLYNDPLIGLLDKNAEGIDTRKYYSSLLNDNNTRGASSGLFRKAFKLYRSVISVLELKADFGVRLKKAYDGKDKAGLVELYRETFEIQKRIKILRENHRDAWHYYNKPFGFEMFDMYYGALYNRFDTVRYHLDNLKNNPDYRIEELEEERLWLFYNPAAQKSVQRINYRFGRLYTPNVYGTCFCHYLLG